jgi:nucleotide-binding universal stress UspA family protein
MENSSILQDCQTRLPSQITSASVAARLHRVAVTAMRCRVPVTRGNSAMIEIKRILCPTDFSDYSRRALDHAVAIARWYNSTITVLHVCSVLPVNAFVPAAPMLPPAVLTPEDRRQLLAAMKHTAEAEVGSSVPIEVELAEGNAASEILVRAAAMASDLIVLGTHGLSGFDRLTLGSVTEKVLRKAECPVLSVPAHAADVVPAPSSLFRRILCAIDFSDCSMRALDYALSLAQEADAHLTVVNVVELPPGTYAPDGTPVALPRGLREYVGSLEADRRTRLQQAVPSSVRAYCTVETVLGQGKPSTEILRVADESKSDLIVIGVHGRGAADRLLFGSTTQHVVRRAQCPVLTLRTK